MTYRGARIAAILALFAASAAAQNAPRFGDAASFVVLGHDAVTNSGPTRITGNAGVSPGTIVTGLTAANFTFGEVRIDDALARQARANSNVIDADLASRACTAVLAEPQLGGRTLRRGVYCFAANDVTLRGTLILDAEGDRDAVWIFRIGGTLTTAPNASVLVANNGYDGNVFWRTGGTATVGSGTSFIGNLFAGASITFQSGASLSGRALTRTGSVILNANRLSLCCAPITVSPATLPNGTLGAPYRQALSADGGIEPYTFAVSSGSLPGGLILDPGGILQGTPRQTGTFAFTVTATDAIGCSGTTAYAIEIACGERTALPEATLDNDYRPVPLLDGGSCTVTEGALPPGLRLAGCALTGVADALGTFAFVVDDGSRSGCFTIDVVRCPIEFPAAAPPDAVACVRYSHAVAVTGGVAPYVFTSPETSCGLTLSPAGVLSGTPSSRGTCVIPATVTDARSRSCSATISVTVGCPPAVGADIVLPDAVAGADYVASLPPRTCGEAGTYSGDLPRGLFFTERGIAGVPAARGTQTFTVVSTTSDGCVITHDVTLEVACPQIALSSLPPIRDDVFYDQTIAATGGSGSYLFEAESLPAGLNLQGARLSGTPSGPGPYVFTVTATDRASGCRGQRQYTSVCERLGITPFELPDGRVGSAYPETGFTVTGGTAPYSFDVVSGSLPPGLSLSSDGTISGSPTTTGAYAFSLVVVDANGCSTTHAFCAIDIGDDGCPANTNIVLSPAALPAVIPSMPYAQAITPGGGAAPYAFALTDGALPPGILLTPAGVITGVTAARGVFTFTVTVTDENGCLASRCYTLFAGTAIPALSQWGLLLVSIVLSIAGFIVVGKR